MKSLFKLHFRFENFKLLTCSMKRSYRIDCFNIKYQVCPCMTSIFLCLIIEFAMCTNAYCKGAWCRFKICCSDLLRRRELKESFQVVPNYKIEIPTFNLLCEICKSARLGVTGVTHIGTCCRTAEKTWLLTTSVYANALIGLVSM